MGAPDKSLLLERLRQQRSRNIHGLEAQDDFRIGMDPLARNHLAVAKGVPTALAVVGNFDLRGEVLFTQTFRKCVKPGDHFLEQTDALRALSRKQKRDFELFFWNRRRNFGSSFGSPPQSRQQLVIR